jgi:hypothetical protein
MWGVSCKRGAHRLVFMTKCYALKVPRAGAISSGCRANRTETDRWKATHNECLCPVICGAWGVFVLMPFASPLSNEEFAEFSMTDAQTSPSNPFALNYGGDGGDFKQSNYGMLRGRIVKIDYGGRSSL